MILWRGPGALNRVPPGVRLRLKRHRITSDDQIFNLLGVEDGQEFFEVVEHSGSVP